MKEQIGRRQGYLGGGKCVKTDCINWKGWKLSGWRSFIKRIKYGNSIWLKDWCLKVKLNSLLVFIFSLKTEQLKYQVLINNEIILMTGISYVVCI